jgi:ActR/RegA family two-component response regulator
LATTFTIIRNHGGHITVDSRKNQGTTFRLYLPSTKPHNQLKSTIDIDTYRAECDAWKAKGPIHVLLVDDEDLVLRSTERVLSRAGFQVQTARTAREAIEAYRNHQSEIQVVLLDLNIPESKGETIYHQLREIDENIKVLVFSGCWDERRIRHMLNQGALGFVSKPADGDALTRALWSALS